ncbi:hypothetical protein BDK92_3286 [Micromonospora pisi]|uniref:Uncharacterized protein n=1 Tax=Micromonospora pisi TaxID=589240 RepID=A0A495JKT0_9ACTN|nr:hypothetical protein [Micromonospora pisi]RKR88952.1 hypothetical protein BDK92_3286 [Micromonospora pisi]
MTYLSRYVWPEVVRQAHLVVAAHADGRMCGRCAEPGDCHRLRNARVEIGTFDPPRGTPIRLAAGEWSHCAGLDPAATVEMRVARVHIERMHPNDEEVWVSGHLSSCPAQAVAEHRACVELLARVDALIRLAKTRSR